MLPDDCIIGFDLRVARGIDEPWFPEYLLRKEVKSVVSVDPMVFPVSPNEENRRLQAGAFPKMNLLGLLTSLPLDAGLEPHEFKIAATVNKEVCEKLVRKIGTPLTTGPLSTASDLASGGWKWLGYDVVDMNGLISGLLNCGPNSLESEVKFSPYINEFALFDNFQVANDYAATRDEEIPNHSPFYPVSLWKKVERVREITSK
jgi:hypothetical protein